KNVVFQPNSDHIKESFLALISPSGQILRQVADILKNHHEITRIRIEGHTDATGTAARNQELSQQRAVAVATWLRAHGVTTQMEPAGFGSPRPLGNENTSACNARNRRVEFVVTERAGATATPPPAGGTAPANNNSGGGAAH